MDKRKAPQKEWRVAEGQTPIKIDTSRIPKVELRLLCQAIAELAERLMEDPKHRAEFEVWQAQRQSGHSSVMPYSANVK